MILSGITTVLIPIARKVFLSVVFFFKFPFLNSQLWILILLGVVQFLSFGVLDTEGHVCILRIHGKTVGPWMQAMHFFYALGTMVISFTVYFFCNFF
jgi:hypothetical protein